MSEKISIKSNEVSIAASDNKIELNANTFIHLSSNESTKIETKLQDRQTNIWLASPQIKLGVESSTKKYEPVVKGDSLDAELLEILELIYQSFLFPGAFNTPAGPTVVNPALLNTIKSKIEVYRKKDKKWKSNISQVV